MYYILISKSTQQIAMSLGPPSISGGSNVTSDTDSSGGTSTLENESTVGQHYIMSDENGGFVDEQELKMRSLQIIHYKNGGQEDECTNVLNNIQWYVRQIFRMVKFFSDDRDDFREPDFVTREGKEKQTSKICMYLFKMLKQKDGELLELINFWKTYRKIVKKDLNKMRTSDINSFKVKFIKGE